MKKLIQTTLTTAIAASASFAVAETSAQPPIMPLVPIETLSDLPKMPAPTLANTSLRPSVAQNDGSANVVPAQAGPITVAATPGVNQLVTVAVAHLNRIVTPFEKPEIVTSGGATVEVRGSVIYIGTNSEVPVSMFVTEAGDESQAISMTLVPRRVPPKEITVSLGGAYGSDGFVPVAANGQRLPHRSATRVRQADAWEKQGDYVSTVTSLLNQLALGEMPLGYDLMHWDGTMPSCQQTGIQYSFANGQTIKGSELQVQVGIALNTGNQPLELDEQACGDFRVAAVAAFPHLALEPGQKTEVYVVMRTNPVTVQQIKRPSLVPTSQVELF